MRWHCFCLSSVKRPCFFFFFFIAVFPSSQSRAMSRSILPSSGHMHQFPAYREDQTTYNTSGIIHFPHSGCIIYLKTVIFCSFSWFYYLLLTIICYLACWLSAILFEPVNKQIKKQKNKQQLSNSHHAIKGRSLLDLSWCSLSSQTECCEVRCVLNYYILHIATNVSQQSKVSFKTKVWKRLRSTATQSLILHSDWLTSVYQRCAVILLPQCWSPTPLLSDSLTHELE